VEENIIMASMHGIQVSSRSVNVKVGLIGCFGRSRGRAVEYETSRKKILARLPSFACHHLRRYYTKLRHVKFDVITGMCVNVRTAR